MQEFKSLGASFSYYETGEGSPVVIWAHGWGQSHKGFLPLIAPFERRARHIALDFPGFGDSPAPPTDWGTEHYADAVAAWIKEQNFGRVLWIGHSFGVRIGLQIAARHPEIIQKMTFIAGAGLKRKRSPIKKAYFYCRIKLFKLLKRLVPEGDFKTKLMAKFGSADYKNAGPMKNIFIRVVNEDLTPQAQAVQCPVTLVYGKEDTETPPEFGERFSRLIKSSELFLLDGQDHYSVLGDGRHQVIKILDSFFKETL